MSHQFKVMLDPRGFSIFIGDGKDYIAADVTEVAAALKHWSGRAYNEFHGGANPECPLCRAMKEEQEKAKLADLIRRDSERRRLVAKRCPELVEGK